MWLYSYGVLLSGPSGRRSSANTKKITKKFTTKYFFTEYTWPLRLHGLKASLSGESGCLFVLLSIAAAHGFVALPFGVCSVLSCHVVSQKERYNFSVVLCSLFPFFVPLCILQALLFVIFEET